MTEKCKGCGSRMIDTGPPIWESFCSNEECTHDYDTFWNNFRKDAQERKRVQRIKDAGPELLEALQRMVSWHGLRDEFDDLLPKEEQNPEVALAMEAIEKAEGKK